MSQFIVSIQILQLIKSHSYLPEDCLNTRLGPLNKIECAILFVCFAGSGPCMSRLSAITQELARLREECLIDLKLSVVEIFANESTATEQVLFNFVGQQLHGNGEIFWIKSGRVVERLIDYCDWQRKVRDYTIALYHDE